MDVIYIRASPANFVTFYPSVVGVGSHEMHNVPTSHLYVSALMAYTYIDMDLLLMIVMHLYCMPHQVERFVYKQTHMGCIF